MMSGFVTSMLRPEETEMVGGREKGTVISRTGREVGGHGDPVAHLQLSFVFLQVGEVPYYRLIHEPYVRNAFLSFVLSPILCSNRKDSP